MAAPERLTKVTIFTLAIGWFVIPSLLHLAPTGDIVEGYMWGREHVLATFKHPALPAILLEASWWLTGAFGWPAYLLAQICVATALWLVFVLGRDVLDEPRAAAAVLSLVAIEHVSWRSFDFNHNIVQMPLWIATMWCAWRAVERDRLTMWLALGAVAAVGCYAKLSHLALLAIVALWILADPQGRRRLMRRGPWLGGATFAVLMIPLLLWLEQNAYGPIEFARGRAYSADRRFLMFLATVVLTLAPMLVMLAAARVFHGERHDRHPVRPNVLRFLTVMTLGPPIPMVAAVLIEGHGFRPSWLAAALLPAPLLILALTSQRFSPDTLRRLSTGAPWFIAVPLAAYSILSILPPLRANAALRTNWPIDEIGTALAEEWRTATGGKPLRIVSGSTWVAGVAGLNHPDRPSTFSPPMFQYAPWITPERLKREGVLIVWEGHHSSVFGGALENFDHGRTAKQLILPVRPRRAAAVTPDIRFLIVPPAP